MAAGASVRAEGDGRSPGGACVLVVSERRKSLGLGIPFLGSWGQGSLKDGVVDGCGWGSFSTSTLRKLHYMFVEIPGALSSQGLSAIGFWSRGYL